MSFNTSASHRFAFPSKTPASKGSDDPNTGAGGAARRSGGMDEVPRLRLPRLPQATGSKPVGVSGVRAPRADGGPGPDRVAGRPGKFSRGRLRPLGARSAGILRLPSLS